MGKINIAFWQVKANEGSTSGLIYMGNCYLNGNGVEQDFTEAHRLLSLAHQKGAMTGTFLLGTMYEEGLGVTQDITRAVKLYEQAAQIDHLYALLNLARIYRNGKGVAVNLSRAEQWYRRIIAISAELDTGVEAEIKEANDFIATRS